MANDRGIVRTARRPAGWVAPGPAPAGSRGRPELEPAVGEDLCYLAGDWRLFQLQRGHRWSLDDLVTAWVATRHVAADATGRAVDLGCGLGSVLLLVAWKLPRFEVVGIEAQVDRAALGRRSIAYNGVEARCRIVDGDLRDGLAPAAELASRSCAVVTGTPPYFPRGTGTESAKPHAMPCRFELRGGVEAYLAAARELVADDGVIAMCSAAIERDRVAASVAAHELDTIEHWEIVPREGKPALVMVDLLAPRTRAASPDGDSAVHTLVVRDRAGAWTPQFRRVREAFGMPTVPP